MLISVAMATHNGEAFLEEQLRSISCQARPPDEVVIWDDGSKDGTRGIVKTFASEAPFAVHSYFGGSKQGATKSFETAISRCTGDVIVLCDQDDVWHPAKLARMERVFRALPSTGGVFSDAELVDADQRSLGTRLWQSIGLSRREQRLILRGNASRVLLKRNVVTGATLAFRASLRRYVLPIPPIWVHDSWIALIIGVLSELTAIQESLVLYRQHMGNQIGVTRGLPRMVVRSFEMKADDYLREAAKYRLVEERLNSIIQEADENSLPEATLLERRIRGVREKRHHMLARARATGVGRGKRLPTVLRETVALRYHNYSLGYKSAAKDLLLPPSPIGRSRFDRGTRR